jgi:hypothetical protein
MGFGGMGRTAATAARVCNPLRTLALADRKLGAKHALKPEHVWAIRFWLDRERRLGDPALFDLAIDSKLRGCDVVKVKISDLVGASGWRSGRCE